VVVGGGCYVGPLASLRGDFGQVMVRGGANVQDGCVLHCFPGRDVVVEEDGHIGHGAVLHGCHIGRGALVGMNSVVMDGAVIGDFTFVGACTFVRAEMEVPARHVVAGNPARVLRELTDAEMAWKANGTGVYQELARRSRHSLRPTVPLPAIEENRPRLSTGQDAAVPLREYRRS
jgi:carbonic anhydrase/acetyltransferase-like protein (isoleucine patch superfamily)